MPLMARGLSTVSCRSDTPTQMDLHRHQYAAQSVHMLDGTQLMGACLLMQGLIKFNLITAVKPQ